MMRAHKQALRGVIALGVSIGALLLGAVPALAAAPETPETGEATSVTATTATLHGVLNPLAEATDGSEFTYGANQTCEGSSTPPQPEESSKAKHLEAHLTGLEASTEYSFCLVATHLEGEETQRTSGQPLKFTTLASKPVVVSEAESAVTAEDATLEAQVNPERLVTTYRFEYSLSKAAVEGSAGTIVGEASFPAGAEVLGTGPIDIGGGLQPGKPYFYRVVTSNATGIQDGPIQSFTTKPLEAPLIDEETVTGVTRTDAQLHAKINPNYQETEYQFKLGTDTSYSFAALPAAPAAMGGLGVFADSEPGVDVAGELETQAHAPLQPNTEYDWEAVASNGSGTTEGLNTPGNQTFLTLPNPPTLSTGEASVTGPTTATIPGTVNPGAEGHLAEDDTTYYVEYGGTTAYGKQTPFPSGEAVEVCRLEGSACLQGVAIVGEGTGAKTETVNLAALEPGVTYHYRVVASNLNDAGELNTNDPTVYGEHLTPQVVYGQDETFTTPSTLPSFSGISVQGVTQSTATISATLETQNLPTRWELQLGSTPGVLGLQASGNTTGMVPLSLTVGSLSPGTVYYYKLIATNADGTSTPPSEGTFITAPGAGGSTNQSAPAASPALIPFQTIAELDAREAKEAKGIHIPTVTKPLTNAQKLKKALKACKKDRSKGKRQKCEGAAHKRYGAGKKGK